MPTGTRVETTRAAMKLTAALMIQITPSHHAKNSAFALNTATETSWQRSMRSTYAKVMVQRLRRVKSVEATSPPQAVVSYPTTQASIAGTSEVTSTHAPRRLRRSSPEPRNAPKPERTKSTKASTSSAVPSTTSSCPYFRATLLDSSAARGRREGPGTTRSRALASIGRRWPNR